MFRSRKAQWLTATALAASVIGLIAWAQLDTRRRPELWQIEVIASYPHDRSAFTQGLAIHDGRMYEGTGHYGASSLRRVDIESGRVEKVRRLDETYFGEGVTVFEDRIYQLTWQNRVGFVYDLQTFDLLETFRYSGEGWGLAHDGRRLIISDGSSSIRFLDPDTYQVVKRISVRENNLPVSRLNELEYVNGEIWANVWYQDRIARISPADGELLGWIDLGELYPPSARSPEDVLNGIAFDGRSNRLFVTGKNWPQLHQISIVRP